MGMYDFITATCPKCGEQIDDQIKGGPCCFHEFNCNMPMAISEAEIVIGTSLECTHCGTAFEIIGDLPSYKIHVYLEEKVN